MQGMCVEAHGTPRIEFPAGTQSTTWGFLSTALRHAGNNLIPHLDEPQLEDCWYGYRCRTQRKHAHAVKLNVGVPVLISSLLV